MLLPTAAPAKPAYTPAIEPQPRVSDEVVAVGRQQFDLPPPS